MKQNTGIMSLQKMTLIIRRRVHLLLMQKSFQERFLVRRRRS